MELIIITAVHSFKVEIQGLLKKAEIHAYSHTDVTGTTDLSNESKGTNWFAAGAVEHQSIVFYAFVEHEYVSKVMNAIKELNASEESHSHVHAAVMEVKETV